MTQPKPCPKCGAELPDGAPVGICPKCLLQAGLEESQVSATESAEASGSSSFTPPAVDELAPLFPNLEIVESLGHGGMGAVYKARQTKLDRLVSLKIIRPETADDETFAERFQREARTLARLNHPAIVGVHDFGEVESSNGEDTRTLYYFIMEYVDGANLRQLIDAQELESQQALAIVPQICEALQFAHDQGVVHRDIKPENILLDSRGQVKIADFGLAKLAETSPENCTLTGTHQVMGTPRYMAPEQMEGSHDVDHRADIYSLGVVFYEMLTGQTPVGAFEPPSKKVQVDVRLDEIVLRSLAREPERRYQNVSEVKTDVETLKRQDDVIPKIAVNQSSRSLNVEENPKQRKQRIRIVIATFIALVASAVAYHFWNSHAVIYTNATPQQQAETDRQHQFLETMTFISVSVTAVFVLWLAAELAIAFIGSSMSQRALNHPNRRAFVVTLLVAVFWSALCRFGYDYSDELAHKFGPASYSFRDGTPIGIGNALFPMSKAYREIHAEVTGSGRTRGTYPSGLETYERQKLTYRLVPNKGPAFSIHKKESSPRDYGASIIEIDLFNEMSYHYRDLTARRVYGGSLTEASILEWMKSLGVDIETPGVKMEAAWLYDTAVYLQPGKPKYKPIGELVKDVAFRRFGQSSKWDTKLDAWVEPTIVIAWTSIWILGGLGIVAWRPPRNAVSQSEVPARQPRDITHMKWSVLPVAAVVAVASLMWLGEGIPNSTRRLWGETFGIWIPMTLILCGVAIASFVLFRLAYRSIRLEWKLVAAALNAVFVLMGLGSVLQHGGGGDAFVSLTSLVIAFFALVYSMLLVGQMIRWLSGDRHEPAAPVRGDSTFRWLCIYALLFIWPGLAVLWVASLEAQNVRELVANTEADTQQASVAAVGNLRLPAPAPILDSEEPNADLMRIRAAGGEVTRLRELLDLDVPVDIKDAEGRTALMAAAENGQLRAMLFLIMNGADEQAKDKFGRTPLMHAAEAGKTRAVELLGDLPILSNREEVQARFKRLDRKLFADVDFSALEFDVSLDVQDGNGETALMQAARAGHIEAVNILIGGDNGQQQSQKTLQDKRGLTAFAHAVIAKQRDFLEAMAKNRDGWIWTGVSASVEIPEFMTIDVLLVETVVETIGQIGHTEDRVVSDSAANDDNEALAETTLDSARPTGLNGLELLEAHGFQDIPKQLREIVQDAVKKLTHSIESGDSDYPGSLYEWRGDMWRLLRERERADADLAEAERLGNAPDSVNTSRLLAAAGSGNLKRLKSLIKDNKELARTTDSDGRTALMLAAAGGHGDCVKYLSDYDHSQGIASGLRNDPAMQDKSGRTAFMHAVISGQTALIKECCRLDSTFPAIYRHDLPDICSPLVLSLRDSGGKTALDLAEEAGHREIATVIRKACHDTIRRMTSWMIEDSTASTNRNIPLMHRGQCLEVLGDEELAKSDRLWLKWFMVSNGSPRHRSIVSLMESAKAGNADRVKAVLLPNGGSSGLDPNSKGPDGETSFMKAARAGHERMVAILLLRGANELERDPLGQTALMHAAAAGQTKVVDLLLDIRSIHTDKELQFRVTRFDSDLPANTDFSKMRFNCGPELQDERGETALIKAAKAGHAEVTLSLTDFVIDSRPEVSDKSGRTALMHAVEAGHNELLTTVAKNGYYKLFFGSIGELRGPSPFFYGHGVLGPTGKAMIGELTVLQYLEQHKQTDAVAAIRKRIQGLIDACTKTIEKPENTKDARTAYTLRANFYRELGETQKAEVDLAAAAKIEREN